DGQVAKTGTSTSSQLLIPNLPYGTYSYVILYPTLNGAGNIRWFSTPTYTKCTTTPASCSTNPPLSVANPSETVSITFSPQYLVQANNNPAYTSWIQAISANFDNGTGNPITLLCNESPPPLQPGCSDGLLSIWLLPGSTVTLASTVTN